MDKSFNEDELSDIMKEIEALEENLHIEEAPAPKISPKVKQDQPQIVEEEFQKDEESKVFSPEAEKDWTEEEAQIPVKEELAPKSPEKVFPIHSRKEDLYNSGNSSPTSMSFKVSGQMHLELQFEVNGKLVQLHVDDSGLVIGLEGGATFNVPLKKSA
jgi:hypothetical protein